MAAASHGATTPRQVFLDTETTGLSPEQDHRIVEIACVEAVNGVPTGREFHHYLDPGRAVPPEAVAIHGLTAQFLRGKPRLRDIAPELIAFVRDTRVLIHCAPFDLAFLDAELRACGIPLSVAALCVEVTGILAQFRALRDARLHARLWAAKNNPLRPMRG